jgi:hypothetical protein
LTASRILPFAAPGTADQPVTNEEDCAAREEAPDAPSVAGRHPRRLFDQIEGDRADQHACTEGHDQPDRAQANLEEERDDCTDHER